MADNVVEIKVKSSDGTKPGFDKAKEEAEKSGDDAGRSWSSRFANAVKSDSSSGRAGISAGAGFLHGFASFAVPGMKTMLITAASAGLAALPALGAIGGAGLVIGMGAMIAAKIPSVAKQFKDFGTQAMGVLKSAVQPMIAPLLAGLKQLGEFLANIGPLLRQTFAAAGPLIEPLVNGLEGIVAGILPGLISLLHAAQPALAAFSNLLGGLGSALGGMLSAFAPAVKASSDVIAMLGSLINSLLPIIGHLAGVFASVLGPVLLAFGNAIHALSPAIVLIGSIFAKLAGAVLTSLSGALTAVAQVLAGLAPSFATLAKAMGSAFTLMENSGVFGVLEDSLEKLAGPIAKLVQALVAGLVPILPKVIALAIQFSAVLSSGLAAALAALATGLTAIITKMPFLVPLILGIVVAIKAWRMAQALLDVVLTANPIGLVIAALAALIIIVVEVVKHWHDIEQVTRSVFKAIQGVISDVIDWIKSHWPLLVGILLGPIGVVAAELITHWHQILSGVQSMISAVTGWFRRLPGMILSAVGNLGSLLFGAGQRVISGLIGGIKSMIGSVGSAIGNIAGEITSHLPFSPAKKGPLSGAGSPDRAGARIAAMLAQGMTGGLPAVSAAANRLAGGAGINGHPAVGAVGGGGGRNYQINVNIAPGGNLAQAGRQMVEAIREFERNSGTSWRRG